MAIARHRNLTVYHLYSFSKKKQKRGGRKGRGALLFCHPFIPKQRHFTYLFPIPVRKGKEEKRERED